MPLDWIDVTNLSFNSLLLLERIQLSWFPGWVPEKEMAIALRANPTVEWYLRHKCPEITPWLNQLQASLVAEPGPSSKTVRQAELTVMSTINDLLVYVIDPGIYDTQPFMGWDPNELLSMADFKEKVVIDVGSGTGKLAFIAASQARVVFAVEPVGNLRRYIKSKSGKLHLANVYPVDGLITDMPFPDGFADITMGGHVFGEHPNEEYTELKRVTKPGGMIILCPGTDRTEGKAHEFLLAEGFSWSVLFEPADSYKRKYCKVV